MSSDPPESAISENTRLPQSGRVDRSSVPPLTRERVADYLRGKEQEIRSVARRRLTRNTRGTHDSEDVYSSVLRRLDELASRGEVRPRSESELWALAKTIASNTAVSKTRLAERARALVAEDGSYARSLLDRLQAANGDDEAMLLLLRLAQSCDNSDDRQILFLRMRGAGYKVIAETLGISSDACRQRWRVLRAKLDHLIRSGALDG